MSKGAILLAAGGTGGHLFPAFALAEELRGRGLAVDLVTDTRAERYDEGFPARQVHRVASATLKERSPLAIAGTFITLGRGFLAARRLIGGLRPAIVVGFGGYPTLPPLFAAASARVPSLLHEQNAVMGRANRLLARFVSAVALSFERTKLLPESAQGKSRVTGNPIRASVASVAGRPYETSRGGDPFRLLVFGGSQGARFFSDTVPPALAALGPELKSRLRIVQQCREEDLARVRGLYAGAGLEAELAAFFSDLPARMAKAQLVIARSGASTVAELSAIGVPAILVPFAHALDNDQFENATRLMQAGAAWCIAQDEATPQRFTAEIARLMREPDTLAKAAAAAAACGRPDAVARLADLVEELTGAARAGN